MNRYLTIVIAATLLIVSNSAFAQQRITSPSQESSLVTYSENAAWGTPDGESNKTVVQKSTRKPSFASPTKPRVVIRRPDRSPADIIPSNFEYRRLAPPTLKQPKSKTGIVIRRPARSPADLNQANFEDRRLAPATRNNPEPKTGVVIRRPAKSSDNSRPRRSVVFAQTLLQPKPQREQVQRQNKVTRISPPKKPATPNALVKQKPSIDPLEIEVAKTQTPIIDNKFEIAPPIAPVAKVLAATPIIERRAKVDTKISEIVPELTQEVDFPAPMKSVTPIVTKETNAFAARLELEPQFTEEESLAFGSMSDDIDVPAPEVTVVETVETAAPLELEPQVTDEESLAFSSMSDDIDMPAPEVTVVETVETAAPVAAVELPANATARTNQLTRASPRERTNRRRKAAGAWWFYLPWLILPVLGWLGWRLFGGDRERQYEYEEISGKATTFPPTYREYQNELRSRETQTAGKRSTTGAASGRSKGAGSGVGAVRDDLTRIAGIDWEAQQALYAAGYLRFGDIENASEEDLKQVFSKQNRKFGFSDFGTWSSQASLARQGEWKTLEQQSFRKVSSGPEGSTSLSEVSRSTGSDDLTKIHGIGPATAELLRKSGITSFRELHDAESSRIKEILASGGSKFTLIDSSLWERQARFAMSGDWSGLKQWQTENSGAVVKSDSQPRSPERTSTASSSSAADDLTQIRGIGPATNKVLNSKGILRFEQVAKMSSQQLDDLFADTGSRFQMQDTSTWPAQAQSLVSQRSGDDDADLGVLEDINSIRAIASGSNSTSKSTSDSRIKSDSQ